jgi:uncharacterized protein (DUF2249 family)
LYDDAHSAPLRDAGILGCMSAHKPEFLDAVPPGRLVHLDVREDIRRGREPFGRIMATVKDLRPEQVFVLHAPFEPLPLYGVLGGRGFAHWAESRAPDDWSVWFWREGIEGSPPIRSAPAGAASPEPLAIDVRGLEPPLPMVKILALLDELAPGQGLVVTHERRPILLYPQLEARGLTHETEEVGPGEFRITIRWEGPTP